MSKVLVKLSIINLYYVLKNGPLSQKFISTKFQIYEIDDFCAICQFKSKIWPNLGQIKVFPPSKNSKTKIKFQKFDQ